MQSVLRRVLLVLLVGSTAVAAVGAIVFLARTSAPPGGVLSPGATGAPSSACTPGFRRRADEPARAPWYTFRDQSDSNGTLVGYTLRLARGGSPAVVGLELPPEAFAEGPYDEGVLVGSDDGGVSTLRFVAPRGCGRILRTASDVILRRATISPDGRQLITFRLARGTREDQGIWIAPIDDPASERQLLPPLPPSDGFGVTWATRLRWSEDGQRLVVESCGQSDCRFRVVDPASGEAITVDEPGYSEAVGLVGDRLFVIEDCGARPCPVVERDIRTGVTRPVLPGVLSAAIVSRGARTWLVANVYTGPNTGIAVADLDSGRESELPLPAFLSGFQLAIDGPAGSTGLPRGWIALAPEGRLPEPMAGGRFFAADIETSRLLLLLGGIQ